MIVMHIAYGIDLIALAIGGALLVWSIKNPGKGSWLGKLVGAVVMALSIICILCMFSCAMKGSECRGPGPGAAQGEGAAGSPLPHEGGHDRMGPGKRMERQR